ncbi:pyridoxal-phosphate dependent enzyme [Phenylobacterium sp.]|jgi:diaminopropionate ammonia-lyase|uniref:pyridoxal-phosphate dependent enzyme n=1 Tax=Phenylobacterium sp. TaxID=1871053 RepID=UPI002F41E75D
MTSAASEFPDLFRALWPEHGATPLLTLPALAEHCGVGWIGVKDESARPLGNFKSLGGACGVLTALARATSSPSLAALLAADRSSGPLPRLICASDGNHGLGVAAAAERVGAPARIYLHAGVPEARVRRIRARGAEVVFTPGTYDDAVEAAVAAAATGAGLLVPDTSDDPANPVVAGVMAGYDLIAEELAAQLGDAAPTHLFVQAGVGGLAAALAEGLSRRLERAPKIVAVEPESAACVAAALASGGLPQLEGDLLTAAEMLSCGRASAPALAVLRDRGALAIGVDEATLIAAPAQLAAHGGPATTPSGAAGLAGLVRALPGSDRAQALGVEAQSRVLLIVTEGPIPETDQ